MEMDVVCFFQVVRCFKVIGFCINRGQSFVFVFLINVKFYFFYYYSFWSFFSFGILFLQLFGFFVEFCDCYYEGYGKNKYDYSQRRRGS